MLWKSWSSIGDVLIVATAAYLGLLVILRVSGKRTLAKLNAFDWIVTVALGSTLATTVLAPNVSAIEGVAAMAALVVLQLVVTTASVRMKFLRQAVESSPRRLVASGRMQRGVMRHERITDGEVLQAVRSSGLASLRGVDVILETNGKLSVVQRGDGPTDALDNVE